MFLEITFSYIYIYMCVSSLFFAHFWRKIMKWWKTMFFFKKKHTCCKGVPGAMCCGKIYDCLRFGGILVPRVLCDQLLRAFISICSPMSSWANGPLARAAKRRRGVNPMMAGMNPFLASMFGSAFPLLVPTRAEIVLMDRWGTLLHVTNNDMGSWYAFFVSCCQTFGTAWPALSKQNQCW